MRSNTIGKELKTKFKDYFQYQIIMSYNAFDYRDSYQVFHSQVMTIKLPLFN